MNLWKGLPRCRNSFYRATPVVFLVAIFADTAIDTEVFIDNGLAIHHAYRPGWANRFAKATTDASIGINLIGLLFEFRGRSSLRLVRGLIYGFYGFIGRRNISCRLWRLRGSNYFSGLNCSSFGRHKGKAIHTAPATDAFAGIDNGLATFHAYGRDGAN